MHSEFYIQSRIFAWAVANEHLIPQLKYLHASPNGDLRHIAVARRLKATGTRKGFPDLILPHVNDRHAGLFIEQKKEGGELSEEQLRWNEYLNAEGYLCVTSYSIEQSIQILLEYIFGDSELVNVYFNNLKRE